MRPRAIAIPLILVLAAAGCASLAPRYARPPAPVPAAWPAAPGGGAAGDEPGARNASDLAWRDLFTSEPLREVIALALANNRDLRVAALAIERARAQYGIARAAQFPEVDGSAGGSVQRVPRTLSSTGRAVTLREYDVGLGVAAYELDLFGRVRSLKDAALERFAASGEARRGVRIALVSETAGRWLSLAADRERYRLAGETLRLREKSLDLTRRRFEGGVSSELDLRQAQSAVETARVEVARYAATVAQERNALDLVVGAAVPDSMLPAALEEAGGVAPVSPGIPSEVLLRRPDILEAEARLRGANADIGAARAAFFPRIVLTGAAGLGSDGLGALFEGSALAWRFAPRITLPIFDAGANRAALATAEADRDILVAQYEKAIQVAFREVADALAQRATIDAQLAAQVALVEAATAAKRLSEVRYEKGVDSYLPVLDAERTLYAAGQELIAIRLARLLNRVTLYKSLGGGA
jgi:multidrug efflux system outer membrane protein